MLRAAGAQLDLPSRQHSGFNGYSKEAKEGQGMVHRIRLAAQKISPTELCLLALLLVVCSGVAALLVANQSIQPGTALTPPGQPTININSMSNADVQIQRIEHEKAQTLAELEPALRRQAELQADVASKHQSIDKLQSKIQGLSDLLVQARYNHSHDLPGIAQEATAGKTPDEQNALWEQDLVQLKSQVQQHQDLAVTMAAQMKATADEVAEYRKRYQAKDDAVKQLRRRNMESHESKTLMQDGTGIKDPTAPVVRTSLDDNAASTAQDSVKDQVVRNKATVDSDLMHGTTDLAHKLAQQGVGRKTAGGAQQEASQAKAANDAAVEEKQDMTDNKLISDPDGQTGVGHVDVVKSAEGSADKETSGSVDQGSGTEEVKMLSPAVNPGEAALDDSVRCRMAGICEGLDACGRGDDLGCITDTAARQQKVREGMQWAWRGYREFAWGEDELLPHSHTSHRWFGLGLTLVDSLDTLHIMGLEEELSDARGWVARNLMLDQDTTVNLFETTIRILGGLLSAFYLTGGDRIYLYKAVELGMRMTPGFHSPSGMPWSDVNLQKLEGTPPAWSASSSLSEVTSLTLEFFTLGSAMGHPDLGKLAREVVAKVGKSGDCEEGVCPVWVNPHSGEVHGDKLSLGSRGDSYYEYLLKHWILTGKTDDALLKQYKQAMKGVRGLLLQRTSPGPEGLTYIAERRRRKGPLEPKMDHLVCFLPGLLALGHFHGVNTGSRYDSNDLELAEELMLTCYEMYRRIPTGLSPEIVFFTQHDRGDDYPKQHHMDVGGGDFMVKRQDSHNLLRPETVESLFLLHQVTGDPQYQDWGWHIFRAFEKFSKVKSGGYTNLDSVLSVPPPHRDKMESFWSGEALKYLYLLLDTSTTPKFPLNEWVFNTEAHPLPVQGSPAEEAVRHQYLSSAEMTHRLSGYRESQHLAEWVQEWQKLDAEYVAQQFPASTRRKSVYRL
ncbi:hypothetical protein WJX77_007859 [Trebouxia sp. C0004]